MMDRSSSNLDYSYHAVLPEIEDLADKQEAIEDRIHNRKVEQDLADKQEETEDLADSQIPDCTLEYCQSTMVRHLHLAVDRTAAVGTVGTVAVGTVVGSLACRMDCARRLIAGVAHFPYC